MVDKKYILNIIGKLKCGMRFEMLRQNYELVLELITNCAHILYETNLYYVDEELEEILNIISNKLNLTTYTSCTRDTIVFYDGFGLNDRGLAQIYLKALCTIKKIVYVTYEDRKYQISDILNILDESKNEILFLNRRDNDFISQIQKLSEILNRMKPESFFFYSTPNDIVGTIILNAYENKMVRYQINLTDHAFWLGARCIDKCIEFRDYGASISEKYRKISRDKIVKLPFYPIVHVEKEFQGYPFKTEQNTKIIFSGGNLYKTLGDDNKYYEMVDNILHRHKEIIFWYAGSGDNTELRKLQKKYPTRVHHTEERSDLFQVLRHIRVYVSTYPLAGGLMCQYAACAGRVPVTLRYDEFSDGLLLGQKQLNIDFASLKQLYKEVDRLLYDDEYYAKRERQMRNAIISEKDFVNILGEILYGRKGIEIEYNNVQTEEFRLAYLKRMNSIDIDILLFNRNTIRSSIMYTPIQFVRGGVQKIIQKLKMKTTSIIEASLK